jgi:protein-tyrosine phosphatase
MIGTLQVCSTVEQQMVRNGEVTRTQTSTVCRTVTNEAGGKSKSNLIKRKGRRAEKSRPSGLCIQKDLAYYSLSSSESPESPPLSSHYVNVKRSITSSQFSSFSQTTTTTEQIKIQQSSFNFSGLNHNNLGLVISPNKISKSAEEKRQEQLHCRNITEVIPGKLFVGALENLSCHEYFNKHNIKTVVSAMSSFPENGLDLPPTVTNHVPITVRDKAGADIQQHFEQVNQAIDDTYNNNGGTLIHCHSGISRSVTFCIAYLLKSGLCTTVNSASNKMAELRPISCPNLGFMGQLGQYLKQIDQDKNNHDSGTDGMDDGSSQESNDYTR